MFGVDSVGVAPGPDFHVPSVVVVPDPLIFFLHVAVGLLLHHHNFVIAVDKLLGNSSVVDVNLPEHLHVLIFETHKVLVELMPLHGDWRVVVEKQVK